jgi:hypothetical protein
VQLLRYGQQLAGGVRTVQLRREDLALYDRTPALPPAGGLLSVAGAAVVTSVRWLDAGLEVRLFNPTDDPGEAQLRFGAGGSFATVQAVDFESNPLAPAAPLAGGAVDLALGPKQICTLRFAQ